MKKVIKGIIITLALAFTVVPFGASAKNIKTLSATEKDGVISVSGTAEAGTLAVAVMVYNETGTELVVMGTTGVASDNTFATEIELPSGTYQIRVADYDGGDYQITTVSPAKEASKVIPTAPNSGKA